MPKKSKRLTKRIRSLIVTCSLTAIVLSVSTYAWFVGMRTVNVSSFDIEIASAESLLLSLDGKKWDTTVSISSDTFNDPTIVYEGNTNSWGGRGLIPMSSIGEMDVAASRMILFEKASLTPTPGGYRLMASRVKNYEQDAPEQEGYVVFDLFVRNFSGTQYLERLNIDDEESIYLTVDSSVTVATGGVENTGIENSVRVAFAQIGRVAGTTTDQTKINGITCNDDGEGNPTIVDGITGICRTAQIWEPNDTKHVTNAINWYNTSCLARTGENVKSKDSYGGACGIVEDGTTYPTYAVSTEIDSSDNVDVYDGIEYNKYLTSETLEGYPLVPYPYFTDTMKEKTGTQRPEFMSLAPNSITKIRVYIYIEGQDVDNYDFASIGKKIAVKFGFTKERFTEESSGYESPPDLDPATNTVKPVITLLGDEVVTITKGTEYVDAGATAEDDLEGDITSKIRVYNPVNVDVAGEYTITYNVSDWAGNHAEQVTRTVIVEEV